MPLPRSPKGSGTIRRPKEGQRAHDDDNGAPLTDGKVEGHDGHDHDAAA